MNSRIIVRLFTFTGLIICILVLGTILIGRYGEKKKSSNDSAHSEGWVEINKNIFMSTNNGINITLIVSGENAVVIDTGYKKTEADAVKKYIEENSLKLKYIILTHTHSDHIANIELLKETATILYEPSNMKDGQVITLGSLQLKFLNTLGHSGKHHYSVELVNEKILIAGDVLTNDWVPYFDNSSTELLNTISTISNMNYSVIIPGHGEIMEAKKTTSMPVVYLENAIAHIKKYIGEEKGISEIISDISITDCNEEYQYLYDIKYVDREVLERVHSSILTKIYNEEISNK